MIKFEPYGQICLKGCPQPSSICDPECEFFYIEDGERVCKCDRRQHFYKV